MLHVDKTIAHYRIWARIERYVTTFALVFSGVMLGAALTYQYVLKDWIAAHSMGVTIWL